MTNDFKSKQSSGARPPRLSPEEYAAKKKAEKEAIYQLLDNTALEVVQSPEKFKAYLDVQSRMDRYTANNALLMYKQFPQASQIKEFDDWAAEGVKVNKGSKTFIILDPYEYTKKDGTIGIDFNLKRVLDVSQTNGKRPPPRPLTVIRESWWRLCSTAPRSTLKAPVSCLIPIWALFIKMKIRRFM